MAKADLEKAAAALKRAQSDYNLVAWRNDIGALPQSQTLQQAGQEYEKAQAAYDLKMKGASAQDLAVLKAQIDQAQAQLNRLYNGPTPPELAAAQAQVDQQRRNWRNSRTVLPLKSWPLPRRNCSRLTLR